MTVCMLLSLMSGPALAEGWTSVEELDAVRVRTDGAILVKGFTRGQDGWGFTPTCGADDQWLIIEAANAQRDLLFELLRTAASGRSVKLYWVDQCAELNPGGELAQLAVMVQLE